MKRALLLTLFLVPLAAGHAEPIQSDPAGGARLEAAPSSVWVDFSEPVFAEGSWLRVVDQDGNRVDLDDLSITGPTARPRMTVSLGDVGDGAYRIQWQTYSKSDGHTINGAIGFAVGGFAPPETTTDPESDVDLFAAASRAVLYAGFALGIGHLAYSRWVQTPVRGSLRAGSWLALAGTAALTLDTWQGTGLGLSAYLTSDGGRDFVIRTLVAAALVVLARTRLGWWAQTMGWAALAWLTAQFGHVTREGLWATGLEWLHLVAVSAWLGGLWLFIRHIGEGATHGVRFTRMAQAAVAVLAITGSLISFVLLRDVLDAGIWNDSWTWFLAAKIALVLAMLALAAVNRWVFLEDHPLRRLVSRWRPDWTATGAARVRGLRRTVRFELTLAGCVLIAAGLLMSVSPPSTDSIQVADGLERTAQGNAYTGLLQVSPQPTVGASHTVRVYVALEGEPLVANDCGRDDCLRLRWLVDGENEQEKDLIAQGDGWWLAEDVLLAQSGNTTMEVDVQSAAVYFDTLVFDPFAV
ncbi:MAG: copper resistance CopC/CopD family protein [Thermoplasmatota archaeon]